MHRQAGRSTTGGKHGGEAQGCIEPLAARGISAVFADDSEATTAAIAPCGKRCPAPIAVSRTDANVDEISRAAAAC